MPPSKTPLAVINPHYLIIISQHRHHRMTQWTLMPLSSVAVIVASPITSEDIAWITDFAWCVVNLATGKMLMTPRRTQIPFQCHYANPLLAVADSLAKGMVT